LQKQCDHVVFACEAGDVLVFQGGTFFHGSPAIGALDPSPRVVTYATFWPPGTQKGNAHSDFKCDRPLCMAMSKPCSFANFRAKLQKEQRNGEDISPVAPSMPFTSWPCGVTWPKTNRVKRERSKSRDRAPQP
jgi:hypothetical protein